MRKNSVFQGKMYDVVHSSLQGDSISFTCYQDDHESWVVQQLDHLLKSCFGDKEKGEEEQELASHLELFCQHNIHFYPRIDTWPAFVASSIYLFFYTSPASFTPSLPPWQA